ncbi:MAG TPA: translation initiation factor IF-5A [Candidatus Lokiarchaeia archaeon]|nr:translation initiation factor IF-5A [Candidatus Lokiarchaeia archaeon]
MAMKRLIAGKIKKGNYFIDDGIPYKALSNDHSKSGKHGHAKNRINAIGLFTGSKKSFIMPSDTALDVPEILKRNASISAIADDSISIMDSESFESFDVIWPDEDELIAKLKELQATPDKWSEALVEYWNVMNVKVIQRVMNV